MYYSVFSLMQSMEDTPTGRSGVRVAAPVDKVSKNESDYATTQNQPMGGDHAAGPALIPGNVMLDFVQVEFFLSALLYIYIYINDIVSTF